MTDQTNGAARRSPRAGGFHWTPRLVIALVLAVVLLIFALSNFDEVEVSLIFWDFTMPLVWALLLSAVIGMIIGLVAPRFRSRR